MLLLEPSLILLQGILVIVESATLPEMPGPSADMATFLLCFEACLSVALAVLASNDLEYQLRFASRNLAVLRYHPLFEVFIVSGVESSRAEVHVVGFDLPEDAVVEVAHEIKDFGLLVVGGNTGYSSTYDKPTL